MNKIRESKGFTLFELLTVLAILSVVTTIGTGVFIKVADLWRVTTVRSQLDVTARYVFDFMRHDFDHVLSKQLCGHTLTGEQRLEENKRYKMVRLEDDSISLPVEEVNSITGLVERGRIAYEIDRKGATPTLYRLRTTVDGNEDTALRQQVAKGVLAMRIEYQEAGVWHPDWHKDVLPEAVRVNITICDAERTWEQITRKTVFTIHVK